MFAYVLHTLDIIKVVINLTSTFYNKILNKKS